MTIRGAAAIGLGGLGLILAALTFESAILFVPGAALVLICLIAPGWVAVAARSASVTRTLPAQRVLEQQPLEAVLEVRYGRLGLPGAEVIEPLLSHPLPLRLSVLQPRGARLELRVVIRFERRGRRILGSPRLTLQDPLGLVSAQREGAGGGQEVLVLPRIEEPRSCPSDGQERRGLEVGVPAADRVAAIEIDGLQPYRQGTPASRIHWLALAQGHGLLERRLRPEEGGVPLVVLDARCREGDERFDQAVRATASLAYFLARRGGCELLLPSDRRAIKLDSELGSWPAAHARLALVEASSSAPAPALGPRHGPTFYVTADNRWSPGRLVAVRLPGAVLVLPAELATEVGQPPTFEVAGCLGFASAISRPSRRGLARQAV